MSGAPEIVSGEDLFVTVRGRCYRSVDPAYRAQALDGSRTAGRYSPADARTLYLSASRAGVRAAMRSHVHARAPELEVLAFDVEAAGILDLRDPAALERAGIALADAVAPWQEVVAAGGRPRSWGVRERVLELGGAGLIDPSRQAPGLWHLTLFAWNTPGTPRVAAVGD